MSSRVIKVFALIGALALVAGMAACILLVRLLRQGLSARAPGSGLEERTALRVRSWAVPERYRKLANPVKLDEKTLTEAMSHWADHCATCHANDGSGQTEMGRNMYPPPPDMRAARTQRMTDGELYYVINQGIRFSGMPAWGEAGDDDRDSWQLVAFIRKLPALTPRQIGAMKGMNPVPASVVKAKRDEDDFLNAEEPKAPHKH